MLNKLHSFAKQYDMVQPGDRIICAVSGGADSVALLFALYLLAPKLKITLEAAHFNHCLRADESDDDEAFVRQLCDRLDIPLHTDRGQVVAGKKGLEAAARTARYAFLESLGGKIATAHTADDNAETVLMHLIRGTGLRGLGGICPIRGNVIRPMLSVTRQEVLEFLREYNLSWREDSSNAGDDFLRNRLRHNVLPLLKKENPSLAQNLSQTALQLRWDEQALSAQVDPEDTDVTHLRQLAPSIRSRWIVAFLECHGVPEPEQAHVALVDQLICSSKPSARCDLPGGVQVSRCYDRIVVMQKNAPLATVPLQIPCSIPVAGTDLLLTIKQADTLFREPDCFTLKTGLIRHRRATI